jgi:hypothetical protein
VAGTPGSSWPPVSLVPPRRTTMRRGPGSAAVSAGFLGAPFLCLDTFFLETFLFLEVFAFLEALSF